MRIPHGQLSTAALRAVVEEFVTRDGTDASPVTARIESVLRQLERGIVALHYDPDTTSCSIQAADDPSVENNAADHESGEDPDC